MRAPSLLGAVALVLVAACDPRPSISIDAGATLEHPVFHVDLRGARGIRNARLDGLRFARCFGEKYVRDAQAAWVITGGGAEHALATLTYGTVPDGFGELAPAQPLGVGECYVVRMNGPEADASLVFRVDATHRLVEVQAAERHARGDSALRREDAFGDTAVVRCRRLYNDAHTASDTARVDSIAVADSTAEFPPLDCGFLRSPASGGLRLHDEQR